MPRPLQKELTQRLKNILGDRYNSVLDAFSQTRKGSFRINTLKGDGSDVFEEFKKKGIITENFDSFTGVYVFDRVHEYGIKGTRAFYDGKIYLQSIASMLPVLALAPERGDAILDVCAAPGSKTTQISAMIDNTGTITAIEQNQIRYDKLMYNTHIQGATNIEGVKMDARKFLETPFVKGGRGDLFSKQNPQSLRDSSFTKELYDRILLDAPCSAEGRIHTGNEKSYGFWSIANIRVKSELQSELISLAYKNLRKGGILVYATCTLAPEENEGVITTFLAHNPDATLEDIDIGISDRLWWTSGISGFDGKKYSEDISKTIRILPSDETEGFYLAKIKKSL